MTQDRYGAPLWALVLFIAACSVEGREFGPGAGGTTVEPLGVSGGSGTSGKNMPDASMPDASLTDLKGEGNAFCDDDGACSCNADAQSCEPLPVCDAGGVECQAAACPGCLIDGDCVGASVTDPNNPCVVCDPQRNAQGWSNNDGVECDDGAFCTVGDVCQQATCAGTPRICEDGVACNGDAVCDEEGDRCTPDENRCGANMLCNTALNACVSTCEDCVIAGICVPRGAEQAGNPCLVCDPARAIDAYSPSPGKLCGSGPAACSGQDTCNASGVCVPNHAAEGTACGNSAASACDLADSCDGRGSCLPRLVANDTPCNDGLFCSVGDECQGGGCVATGTRNCGAGLRCNETGGRCECQGCTVGGNCFADRAPNGSNSCQICDPARSRTAFSANTNAQCGSGPTECSGQDTCNSQGQCAPNHVAASTPCSSVAGGQCQGDGRCLAVLRGLGDACDNANQCSSGSCVNNVCCGSPSCAACEQCGQGGVCRTRCGANERCASNVCVDPLAGRPPILVSALAQGGNLGFPINGAIANDFAGIAVAGGGDFNADGRPDIIIASDSTRSGGLAYVVFGSARTTPLSLAAIENGQGGYTISGTGDAGPGTLANAGDVNGDGRADIVIGAPSSNRAVVVFGQTVPTSVALANVAAGQGGGFAINGPAGDLVALVVGAVGDVNGDGRNDVFVQMSRNGGCVVFGKTTTTAVNCGAPGAQGFLIVGAQTGDDVTSAAGGDVNGDGMSDVILGMQFVDRGGNQNSGVAHVVFGKTTTTAVQLTNVEAGQGGGFVIHAARAFDQVGAGVARAGDLNGDGRSDVLIGAPGAPNDPAVSGFQTGRAYLVFGKTSAAAVQLSAVEAGQGGFMIDGAATPNQTGSSVAGLGDVNGDGVDDLLINAQSAGPGGASAAGTSYVVFGKADTSAVSLAALEAGQRGGYAIFGTEAFSGSLLAGAAAGDQNGDGVRDLLIGRNNANGGGLSVAGSVLVVFGRR